jgi:hypothetical protein
MMASTTAGRRTRALVAPVLLLVVLLVVHSLDHSLRQSAPVPAAAAVAGLAGFGVALVALALAAAGSRLAPAATAFVGLATAAGFVAVHMVPEWSIFSQPYADIKVDGLSWIGMLVPAVAAAAVGMLGLRSLERS